MFTLKDFDKRVLVEMLTNQCNRKDLQCPLSPESKFFCPIDQDLCDDCSLVGKEDWVQIINSYQE